MFFSTKYLGIILLSISYLLWICLSDYSYGAFSINFLNVGQGDSILIRTPSHKTILIDGGASQSILPKEISKILPFYDRTIDMIIVSHSDQDHLAGLLEIIDTYQVGSILISGVTSDRNLYQSFLNKIENKNIKVFIANSEQDFLFDNSVYVDVLYPFTNQKNKRYKNINNSSVIVNIHYKEESFLLLGDIESEVHPYLEMYGEKVQAKIVKISHHGAKNGTTKSLLKAINPEIAILSYGKENKYGHPHQETLDIIEDLNIETCHTLAEECAYSY